MNQNKEVCEEKCCSPYRPDGLCPHSCHKGGDKEEVLKEIMNNPRTFDEPNWDKLPKNELEKVWTCPCGKPAETFGLCSIECEDKYTDDTFPSTKEDSWEEFMKNSPWKEIKDGNLVYEPHELKAWIQQKLEEAEQRGQHEAAEYCKEHKQIVRQQTLAEVVEKVEKMKQFEYKDGASTMEEHKGLWNDALDTLLAKLRDRNYGTK